MNVRQGTAWNNKPLARRYVRLSFSEAPSSQRDSTPSNPPSPSIRSSRDMSTGPSLSPRTIPLRRRITRAHMRKERRRKRKVERTMRRGRRTSSASPPLLGGCSGDMGERERQCDSDCGHQIITGAARLDCAWRPSLQPNLQSPAGSPPRVAARPPSSPRTQTSRSQTPTMPP